MEADVLREFLAETEDLLEVLFGDLQALRARRSEGRARRELVGRIFRHVHTIKGSSATVGLKTVSDLTHEFENLLDGVRMGRVKLEDPVLDIFEVAANSVSHSLGALARNEAQPEVRPVIDRLSQLARQGENDAPAPPPSPSMQRALAQLPPEVSGSLSRHEQQRLREALQEGARLFVVNAGFDIATFDERFRDLSDALAEDGEIILTLPGVAGTSSDRISFQIIYATRASREELTERAGAFGKIALTELSAGADEKAAAGPGQRGAEALRDGSQPSSIAPLTTHVRVELSRLDEIIGAAHELFAEAANALGGERAVEIRQGLLGLEGRLIELRMVPAGQMIERAARAGRMAARATGKEVKFELKGAEVRLDKALADVIADPLLHILRNAVDHGVEAPSERTKVGKGPRGLVRLEAATEGNRVAFRVWDDGRGIDPLRITRAAAAQGLIEAGRLLTKQESLRLIFRPGFTTAATVTGISGRGVGLDVVERAVEKVGGELRVESEPGKGTVFEVSLPAMLALLPSLVVRSAGHSYCIDAARVYEAAPVVPGQLPPEANAIDWRGSRVPLLTMRRLLGQPPAEAPGAGQALVVVSAAGGLATAGGNGSGCAAILVDEVDGRAEALVRGLGRHAGRWRAVSGAAELGDGTIALVLDLTRLLEVGA